MTRIAQAIRLVAHRFIDTLTPVPPQLLTLADATRDCAPGMPNPFAPRR